MLRDAPEAHDACREMDAPDTALRLNHYNRGTLAADHFLFADDPSKSESRCRRGCEPQSGLAAARPLQGHRKDFG